MQLGHAREPQREALEGDRPLEYDGERSHSVAVHVWMLVCVVVTSRRMQRIQSQVRGSLAEQLPRPEQPVRALDDGRRGLDPTDPLPKDGPLARGGKIDLGDDDTVGERDLQRGSSPRAHLPTSSQVFPLPRNPVNTWTGVRTIAFEFTRADRA